MSSADRSPAERQAAAPGVRAWQLGLPRLHLRATDSTNQQAHRLAQAGAVPGTLVTAASQSAGRGRQQRQWWAPPGRCLLCSLIMPVDIPTPLSLLAGVALCDAIGERAQIKWPNDILIPGDRGTPAKVAGILVEGRPQAGWLVLGIGVNVAVRAHEVPPALSATFASLQHPVAAIEPLLASLLAALEARLHQPRRAVLDAWRSRDALIGRRIRWSNSASAGSDEPQGRNEGVAGGINEAGALLVDSGSAALLALNAGEVHLPRQG